MQVIQIISIIGSIAFFITVVELIRHQKLKEAYGIIWLIFSFLFMIFSFWRKGLDYVSVILSESEYARSASCSFAALINRIFSSVVEKPFLFSNKKYPAKLYTL